MSAIYAALFAGVGWVVVDLIGLTGTPAQVARMTLIGAAFGAVGLIATLKARKAKRAKAERDKSGAAAPIQDAGEEIAFQLKDAEERLIKSRLGKDATLANLPAFLVLGEDGAAKTSNFISSGVNPELLSGHVYNEGQVAPTRALNLWFGQSAVFVELGGAVLADDEALRKLGKRLQAKRGLTSLFGRQAPAPRAVLVCLEAEKLLKGGSEDLLQNAARLLHGKLSALSQALGVNLPVYVLFTKADRIAFFSDFVANLSDEEARQVFGSTLTLRPPSSEVVYGEAETRRVTEAFNELFYSLCDKRPPFLAREHDQHKQGGVYEFPREFRKLRGSLVRFLVDLCRPSQLQAGPILRGFYFSGVRPVVVEEQVAAPRGRQTGGGSVATGIFELHGNEGRVAPPEVRRRRVAQWVFLGKLFSEILLGDKAAQGTGAASVHARILRRGLIGLAAGMLLIWSAGMTISYFNNRSLQAEVLEAARGIGFGEGGGAGEALPSLDALQRLDRLRAAVGVLSQYQREGAPLRYRWGLYAGNRMYPPSRQLYFNRFHQVLFGATQASLLEWLRNLPLKPGPDDEYKPSYDTLKAYLMTTSHHDKTTRDFLSPLLLERWSAGRDVDPERLALAARQFDFYADELLIANPFEETNDQEAVAHARRFLAQFNALERLYQALLAQAAEQAPAVNFNRKFPGSAAYVVNNRDVSGAFSVKGWQFMNEALAKAREFFGGERWVLGDEALEGLDPATLEPELRARYRADFLGNWREYLNNSAVVRYRSVPDAASKLGQLSSNQSHLMALFCLGSINTNVGDEDIKGPFQPLHLVTPPEACEEQYIGDSNRGYMGGLVALQTSMDRVAQSGTSVDEQLVEATLNDATAALRAAAQTAQNFRVDREGVVNRVTQKLMEDPIRYAEGMLGRLGPAQVNGQGKGMCDEFDRLISKYPFKSDSKIDATLDEVGAVFRPGDGALWRFYEGTLRSYVDQVGSQYVQRSDSKVKITDRFLNFFNRAARFSNALYPGGVRDPRLAYAMQALPAEGVRSLTLTLDGQSLKGERNGGGPQEFVWPGAGVHGARLAGSLGGPEIGFIAHQGLWAAFRFFADSDRFQAQGSSYRLEWVPRQGQSGQPMTLENGRPLAIPFVLDLKGAPPIFQKGYLEGFGCVSQVAQ